MKLLNIGFKNTVLLRHPRGKNLWFVALTHATKEFEKKSGIDFYL